MSKFQHARAWVAGVLLALAGTGVHATVIDFDSYGVAQGSRSLDGPIDGFVFNSSMDVIDISASAPSWLSITGPAHSGNYAAANNDSNNSVRSADGSTFTFSSLWVRQYAGGQPSNFTVIGMLNGLQVGSATVTSFDNWTKLTASFGVVDTLLFQHDSFWVMDDLLVNASAVPEPQAYAMLLAGVGMIGWTMRRRQRRTCPHHCV